MRLTCPNCDAQYEVPSEVIPEEGRDVQCSNCGDTWFQAKHQAPETLEYPEDISQEEIATDAPTPVAAPAPATNEHRKEYSKEYGDNFGDDHPDTLADAPEQQAQQHDIDPAISGILREEAEREAQLRAAETADPLESQPDLGLDNMPGDEPARRADEARNRMARIRGGDPSPPNPVTDPGSRRGLLPDIEEINSTLRNSDAGTTPSPKTTAGTTHAEWVKKKRSGFTRGFSLIIIAGVALGLVYAKSSNISQAVPQAAPVLSSYVGMVDQARVWIDARLGEYLKK